MKTIYVTATATEWTQDEHGDPEDTPDTENGWIDVNWSRTQLHEYKSDVRPFWTELDFYSTQDPDDSTLPDSLVKSASQALTEFGPVELSGHNGYGIIPTFYAVDSYQPFDSNIDYSYALHLDGFSDNELESICNLLTS